MNYFLRHWRGELSLPLSYWLNGILGTIVVTVLVLSFASALEDSENSFSFLIYWLASIAVVTSVTAWQLVGVWRSAERYEGLAVWSALARLMVIVGFMNLANRYSQEYIPAINESIEFADWRSTAQWRILLLKDGHEIELAGAIGDGISRELSIILDSAPSVELVHVNLSQGGLVKEATRIQKLISQRGLSTYVSGECVSACTIVYLGGVNRYLKSTGRIGFHAYSTPGVKQGEMSFFDQKEYLRSFGIKNSFVEKIFATPSDDMWYPTVDELVDANVVHKVVSGEEFAITGIESKESTVYLNSLDSALDEMKSADVGEEIRFNKLIPRTTELISDLARSPASVEFVRLTDRQNTLSKKGEERRAELISVYRELEAINLESDNEDELQEAYTKYARYCKLHSEYISLLSEMVEILNQKVVLLEDPSVLEELAGNQQGVEEIVIRIRNTQFEVLANDEKAYRENECEQFDP